MFMLNLMKCNCLFLEHFSAFMSILFILINFSLFVDCVAGFSLRNYIPVAGRWKYYQYPRQLCKRNTNSTRVFNSIDAWVLYSFKIARIFTVLYYIKYKTYIVHDGDHLTKFVFSNFFFFFVFIFSLDFLLCTNILK